MFFLDCTSGQYYPLSFLNEFHPVISAVRRYAGSEDKDLNLLADYASLLGVSKILKGYMEVLFEWKGYEP